MIHREAWYREADDREFSRLVREFRDGNLPREELVRQMERMRKPLSAVFDMSEIKTLAYSGELGEFHLKEAWDLLPLDVLGLMEDFGPSVSPVKVKMHVRFQNPVNGGIYHSFNLERQLPVNSPELPGFMGEMSSVVLDYGGFPDVDRLGRNSREGNFLSFHWSMVVSSPQEDLTWVAYPFDEWFDDEWPYLVESLSSDAVAGRLEIYITGDVEFTPAVPSLAPKLQEWWVVQTQ